MSHLPRAKTENLLNLTVFSRSLCVCFFLALSGCAIIPMKSGDQHPADEPPVYGAPGSEGTTTMSQTPPEDAQLNAPRIDLFDLPEDTRSSTGPAFNPRSQRNQPDLRNSPLMEPGNRVPGGDMMLSGLAFSDLWERVRAGYGMDLTVNNRRVKKQRDWYVKHSHYLLKVLERARPYLYQVVTELEAQQIPLEIALLPVIESAYDPFAYSRSGAAGLWQFIPSTGASLGLKQNWWYDGRRDISASTRAAATYLNRLNKMFDGDWELALAAYNGGNGTIRRAREKNARRGKATDYWSLKLSDETSNYVPKLIALAQIMQNPSAYGFNPLPVANTPYFTVVKTDGQIDLARASQMSGIDLEQLYRLNPAFNRWASDPAGPHQLALPVSKAKLFQQTLSNFSDGPKVNWRRYTVQRGDTLSSLAKQCNTTISQIRQANHIRGNSLRSGQQLILPVAAERMETYAMSASNRLDTLQSRPRGPNKVKTTHKVQPGETLWSIASKYGISVAELSKSNGTSHRDTLSVGQSLVIWRDKDSADLQMSSPEIEDALNSLAIASELPSSAVESKGPTGTIRYKVQSGDSLYKIADKFNVSVAQITQWNDIKQDAVIHPGQELKLFVGSIEEN